MQSMKSSLKRCMAYILAFSIFFMGIFVPTRINANSISGISFYYIIPNGNGGYDSVFANNTGAVNQGSIALSTSLNAVMRNASIPSGKTFGGWRLAKVEPSIFLLEGLSTPSDATPNVATPSVATPSTATPSTATPSDADAARLIFSDYVFRPGEVVNMSEYMDWINGSDQVAFYPVFYDITPNNLPQETQSSQEVQQPQQPQQRVPDETRNIEYIAPSAPIVVVPPTAEPENPNSITQADGVLTGSQTEEVRRISNSPKEFFVSATPKPSSGWYNIAPQIQVTSEDTDTVHYKLWNSSRGETEKTGRTGVYEGKALPFIEDGVYYLRVWRTSTVADTSKDKEFVFEFKIDRFAPQVTLRYSGEETRDGAFFKSGQTAIITIKEANFSKDLVNIRVERKYGVFVEKIASQDWKTIGDVHTLSFDLNKEGIYSILVEARDQAGKKAEDVSDSFTVDTIKPMLSVSGVTNLSANAKAVLPIIKFSDSNVDMERTEIIMEAGYNKYSIKDLAVLKGGIYTINMKALDKDDYYVLHAKIYDKAGNVSEEKIGFSVNIKGATFVFLPKEYVGKYVNTPFYPKVEVWNTDEVNIVSATINGKDVDYSFENGVLEFMEMIEKDGKYTVNLEVSDTAGNITTMKPVEFYFDSTRPINIVLGVENNAVYNSDVKISIYTENPADLIQSILLNGTQVQNYIKNDKDKSIEFTVKENGDYILEVVSKDEAGNLSDMDPISFKVEKAEQILAQVNSMNMGGNEASFAKGNAVVKYLPMIALIIGLPSTLGIALRRRKKK